MNDRKKENGINHEPPSNPRICISYSTLDCFPILYTSRFIILAESLQLNSSNYTLTPLIVKNIVPLMKHIIHSKLITPRDPIIFKFHNDELRAERV